MSENHNSHRREFLQTVATGASGLVVGTGTVAAKKGRESFRGIAYDMTTGEILGNTIAKVRRSEGEVKGGLQFTASEDGNRARLRGAIPNHENPDIDLTKFPKAVQEKLEKSDGLIQEVGSINLLNRKIPIEVSPRITREFNDGITRYESEGQLYGTFSKNQMPSRIELLTRENSITGKFIAPNKRQRIGFSVIPAKSRVSRGTLIEGVKQ